MSGRIISRAESWDITYQAWQDINFAGFDFNTIKASMIDYVKLYFPETFNDYIESSEFIAFLELFAYVGELLIYRVDVGAHENFMPLAQRKQSVLRLAKLISYNASRNIPARGLVKITSVSTSEQIIDSQGINLQNVKVLWNDTSNPFWKEQFLLVINRILEQPFGSVSPNERFQIQDVLFELYSFNNTPTQNGIIPYNITTSGSQLPMELVPVSLDQSGPFERRPELNTSFSVVYGNDGLGDSSTFTGFFALTKQGQLGRIRALFDGRTPNQTIDLTTININDIDLWVNNVDSNTGEIIDNGSNPNGRSGEWMAVDLENAQNILFNTNTNPNKYEVETLENDSVRIIFGDNQFANIPSGTFDFWFRTSENADLTIPQNVIIDVGAKLPYTDNDQQPQTFSFTYSLTNTLQNASASEDIEHIRKFSGGVYYTLGRMVNARDYNVFMLQDSTILKLKTINRAFAGESKYVAFTNFGGDPSEAYDNVRMFGTDLALYFKQSENIQNVVAALSEEALVTNYIEPLLANINLWLFRATEAQLELDRKVFTQSEKASIVYALGGMANSIINPSPVFPVQIYYDSSLARWRVTVSTPVDSDAQELNPNILINIFRYDSGPYAWVIINTGSKLIGESPNTRFWFTTKPKITVFDTLNAKNDTIDLLQANIASDRVSFLPATKQFIIIDDVVNDSGVFDAGLPNINQVEIIPDDSNQDGIPDNPTLVGIIDIAVNVDGGTSGFQLIDLGGAKQLDTPTNLKRNSSGFQSIIFTTGIPTSTSLTRYNDTFFAAYQDIITSVSLVAGSGNLTNLSGNSHGYQIVNLGGPIQLNTPTGLSAGVHNFFISVDNIVGYVVQPDASTTPDFNALCTVLNAFITAGINPHKAIVGLGPLGNDQITGSGYLKVVSNEIGPTSIISLSGTGWTQLAAQGPVAPTILAAVNGGNATFTFSVIVNGGPAQIINILGSTTDTYDKLVIAINQQLTGGLAAIVNGSLRISSMLVSGSSAILIIPGSLFTTTSLPQFVRLDPPNLNSGSTREGRIVIDGNIIQVTLDINVVLTFDVLLSVIQGAIGALGTIRLSSGILSVISTSVGSTSTVVLSGSAFTGLGYGPTITSSIAGTSNTYTCIIKIDGEVTPHVVSLFGDAAQTYQTLIDQVNQKVNNQAILSLKHGNLVLTSVTTSSSSSIGLRVAEGGSPGNLFNISGDLGVLTLPDPVSGSSLGGAHTTSLPVTYIRGRGDVVIVDQLGQHLIQGTHWIEGTGNLADPIVNENITILDFNGATTITITVFDYVYFFRLTIDDPWEIVEPTDFNKQAFDLNVLAGQIQGINYKRLRGRNSFNFLWQHQCPQYNLIDPCPTNIMDTFIITKGYYNLVRGWLSGTIPTQPTSPTPLDLRLSYNYLTGNKMISDSMILHPGVFTILFGKHAIPELQGSFKVVRSSSKTLTDNQIKLQILSVIRIYFDINKWEFGETFYFSELAAFIHASLPTEIETVVLVPIQSDHYFGDLFQVNVKEDQIVIPSVDVENIEIVESLSKTTIKQFA